MRASHLQFCFQLARGIAQQFGSNCEVVVHDLDSNDVEHSIVAIENGHVSGRRVGDGPSHIVLEALRGDCARLEDRLAYLTRSDDGKILKSSTIYIRDDDGRAIGVFAINYDITLMLAMEDALKGFTATQVPEREPEHISRNVADLLDELIEQSVKLVGTSHEQRGQGEGHPISQRYRRFPHHQIRRQGVQVLRYFQVHPL